MIGLLPEDTIWHRTKEFEVIISEKDRMPEVEFLIKYYQ